MNCAYADDDAQVSKQIFARFSCPFTFGKILALTMMKGEVFSCDGSGQIRPIEFDGFIDATRCQKKLLKNCSFHMFTNPYPQDITLSS